MKNKISYIVSVMVVAIVVQNCGPSTKTSHDELTEMKASHISVKNMNCKNQVCGESDATLSASSQDDLDARFQERLNKWAQDRRKVIEGQLSRARRQGNFMGSNFRGRLILKELEDYYTLYLQREPDAPGLEFWSMLVYTNTISMERAKNDIKNSPEALSVGEPPIPGFYDFSNVEINRFNTICKAGERGNPTGRDVSPKDGYVVYYRKHRMYYGMHQYVTSPAYYKEDMSTTYCVKSGYRCHSNTSRTRHYNVRPLLSPMSSCSEKTFAGRPETSDRYIKDLYQDLVDVYRWCKDRDPSPYERDQHITSIVENGKSLYDIASNLCSW